MYAERLTSNYVVGRIIVYLCTNIRRRFCSPETSPQPNTHTHTIVKDQPLGGVGGGVRIGSVGNHSVRPQNRGVPRQLNVRLDEAKYIYDII